MNAVGSSLEIASKVSQMKSDRVSLSRRSVLKGIGSTGVAVSVSCPALAAAPARRKLKPSEMQTFRSSCTMECLHCNLTAYVAAGKVVKVEASKGFNVTGCKRGISRTKWIAHKDRLTTPLLRTGEKGEGKFRPISWTEALDLIEKNLRDTIATLGNKGLMLSMGSGNMDSIKNGVAGAFFAHLGGVTPRGGSLCCSAVTAAMEAIVGFRYVDTRDTIADSKYIVCWGNNPAVTMNAYWKDYVAAQKKGAKIVVIDPRFSETAAKADTWVPIVPGTDTALALGMMNVILREKLIDAAFLTAHTGAPYLVDGNGKLLREKADDKTSYLVFDSATRAPARHDKPGITPALSVAGMDVPAGTMTVLQWVAREAEPWTPERTAQETEVPADMVVRLAREYAKSPASMIIQNMSGAQRTEFGTYVAASQFYLALLTGHIGKPGTGVLDAGGATQMAKIGNPIAPPPKPPAKIPMIPVSKTGEWIATDRPHKIGLWWIMTTSPLTQYPNTNAIKRALKHVPFVVVADNLMTSTAKYADLVLPVTTIFEDVSLVAGTRSHYVQLMEKAVEPPGEARPDYWIFQQLAKRFGFGPYFDIPVEKMIESCLKDTGITLAQLKQGPVKPAAFPWVPFKDGIFRTPTKKAHFFAEEWADKKFMPVVTYKQVQESPKGSPELARRYPLMAIQRKLARSIHSSHGTNEWLLELDRTEAQVLMHPVDAIARDIRDGDWTVVHNDRGQHRCKAVVTEHIKRGVICLDNGWWEEQGGSSSHVTNDAVEVLGTGHCCNSTLVNVRKEA